MRLYIGKRDQKTKTGGLRVFYTDSNEVELKEHELNPRNDLYNHSPNGFEWGYGGSGPAQLALALLADVLKDDDRAIMLHQAFKGEVVASKFPKAIFVISDKEILDHVAKIEGKEAVSS